LCNNASDGYPEKYQKGFKMTLPTLNGSEEIFIAGAKTDGDDLLTNGGRVLGATTVASTLEKAIESSYKLVDRIHFDNKYYRKDIGAKALKAIKEN